MRALVDADIVGFSCAAYNEQYSWEACRNDIDALMRRILEDTDSDDYLAVLTGSNNFRYDIYPEYKANRKEKARPTYLEDSRAHLITEWGAVVTDGYEADDLLGIEQSQESFGTTVICSIDKDLKQVPGYHYNWRKLQSELVSPLDGWKSFYRQLLTGDSTDGIPGVGGIGKVKSSKLIDDLVDETDMLEVVSRFYDDPQRLLIFADCLWIMRKENERWSQTETGLDFIQKHNLDPMVV